MKITSLSLFLLTAFLLAACAGGANSPGSASESSDGVPWPTDGWKTSTPEEQGMDPAMLKEMQSAIPFNDLELHSLLVIRNGYIVFEKYYAGNNRNTRHELYSVTKSFTSTLVGIAFDQGKLKDVNLPVLELFSDRQFENVNPDKEAMTVENLLTMTSGLEWPEGDAAYRQMYMSPDWVQMVLDIPMAVEPGKDFLYCSGCSHVLSASIAKLTGENTLEFAKKNLFEPLGMKDIQWDTDSQGIPIGGWGLHITPRDMARLGLLYLHNGRWEDKQVLSASWVEAATRKQVDVSSDLGYGYQWWIDPTGLAYSARGRYGQTIYVVPDRNLVIVNTAEEDNHDAIFRLFQKYILPAVKK